MSEIKISFNNVEELKLKLADIYAALVVKGPEAVVEEVKPEPVVEEKPVKKSNKKAAAVVEEVKPDPIVEMVEALEVKIAEEAKKVEEKKATLDEVRTALSAVVAKTSMEQGKSILLKFGADRMSALKPENYVAFISECNTQAELA